MARSPRRRWRHAGRSSTLCASRRWWTRAPRCSLSLAGPEERWVTGRSSCAPACSRRASCTTWRTRASRPCTTADGRQRSAGLELWLPGRSSRGAAPEWCWPALARPRGGSGTCRGLPLAARGAGGHRRLRADGARGPAGGRLTPGQRLNLGRAARLAWRASPRASAPRRAPDARDSSPTLSRPTPTSAASSTVRSPRSRASSSRRNTRSVSAAAPRRAVASHPATTSDSCSIRTAARRTGVIRSSMRARSATNESIRSPRGREASTGWSSRTTFSYCWRATASNRPSRSGKCWKTERSDTPARSAMRSAVGRSSPSSSSANRASISDWRVRSARTVRPSFVSLDACTGVSFRKSGVIPSVLLTAEASAGLLDRETHRAQRGEATRM